MRYFASKYIDIRTVLGVDGLIGQLLKLRTFQAPAFATGSGAAGTPP